MSKIIRPTYPLEFSIGLLLLIFLLSSFLSFEIFDVKWHEIVEGGSPLFGMALTGISVVVMSLILWEEFLFPVRIRPVADELIFRNHFTKLKTEIMIYCTIPVIVVVVFLYYKVSYIPFFIWATICLMAPLRKLISGVKNYNDFLKITNETIEFKNNEKEGIVLVKDIIQIVLIRDEEKVLHKVQLVMSDGTPVIIDLDEMELEAYYHTIDEFVKSHYGGLVK
jgi:hypothetical protein